MAYYAVAKIAWITPLRDGLNLVAKEYVAVQGQLENPAGVLILSEFAGASVDLHYAVLTNPYDIQSLKNSLSEALNLQKEDQAHRIQRLYEQVEYYDINYWARKYEEQLGLTRKK
jgi:trehalose-6-phosphate synthase